MADDPRDRPMPSSFDEDDDFFARESALQKFARKAREEPLIPLGLGLTIMALLNAMRASRRGDSHTVQRMFRARVAAQAFTVVAMMAGGLYYSKDRQRTAELRKVQQARDAEEKRIRWIKELEVRDEEEKERVRALDAKKAARRTEKLGAASGEEEKGIVAAAVAAATPPSPAAAPKEGLSGGLISGLVGKTKASDGGGKGEGPA